MTREEAIKAWDKWRKNGHSHSAMPNSMALVMAYLALRGPTREQVEKVWKGEWINKHSVYDHKIFTCAQCGKQISIQGENLDFCPKCGSAQTDEAVEIVMKRLGALKDGTKSD